MILTPKFSIVQHYYSRVEFAKKAEKNFSQRAAADLRRV